MRNGGPAEAQVAPTTWGATATAGAAAYPNQVVVKASAVDAAGNTYVTGVINGMAAFGPHVLYNVGPGASYDCFVAKLTAGGSWAWAVQGSGPQNDISQAVRLDGGGNVLIAGFSSSPTMQLGTLSCATGGQGSAFVGKLATADGHGQWVAVGGSGGALSSANDLAVDAAGNAYVTGQFAAAPQSSVAFGGAVIPASGLAANVMNAFVAKISASGQWRWAVAPTLSNSAGQALSYRIACDRLGQMAIGGMFDGTIGFGAAQLTRVPIGGSLSSGDLFVAWLDSLGNWGSAAQATGMNLVNPDALALALDAQGHVFVAGEAADRVSFGSYALPRFCAYLARLHPTGYWEWARPVARTVPYNNDVYANQVVADAGGNALVAGGFCGRAMFGSTVVVSHDSSSIGHNADLFIAKFDAAGNYLWETHAGASNAHGGTSGTNSFGVVGFGLDGFGNARVVGPFGDELMLGTTTLTGGYSSFYVAQLLLADPVITRVDPGTVSGTLLVSGTNFLGTTTVLVNGVAATFTVDAADRLRLTLPPGSTAPFTVTVVTSAGTATAYPPGPLGVPGVGARSTLDVWPNPARHVVQLRCAEPGEASVTDILGQCVRTGPAGPVPTSVSLAGLPAGVYTVRVGAITRRLVVE